MYSLEKSEKVLVIKVEKIDSNKLIWKVIFERSEATPYVYTLKLEFHTNYPTKGPEAYFITKMFNSNITEGERQHMYINIFHNDKWKEIRTVEDIILGIN